MRIFVNHPVQVSPSLPPFRQICSRTLRNLPIVMLANRSVWNNKFLSIFDLTCLATAGLCFISGLLVHVADSVLPSLKQNFTPVAFSFKSAVTKWQIAQNTYRSLHCARGWLLGPGGGGEFGHLVY